MVALAPMRGCFRKLQGGHCDNQTGLIIYLGNCACHLKINTQRLRWSSELQTWLAVIVRLFWHPRMYPYFIMDAVDPFSVRKITSVAESAATILESREHIPPEVRHYLTLLRQLCGDVQRLHGLREKRIEYLRAAPHDLSETNGILAVSMLGASEFELILSNYQPTCSPQTAAEPGQATTRSNRTAWKPDDIRNLCKMAENLPFQRESIGATIGRLEDGLSHEDKSQRTTKPDEPPASSKRISNVHLLNSLFGSRTNDNTPDLQRPDSLASSVGKLPPFCHEQISH